MLGENTHIPKGMWGWQETATVVLVIALPSLMTLWLAFGTGKFQVAQALTGVVSLVLILASAIALYVTWRLTHDDGLAWLAAALLALAVDRLLLAGHRMTLGHELDGHAATVLVTEIGFTAFVVTMLLVGRLTAPRLDPVVLGLGVGFIGSVVRMALLEPGWANPAGGVAVIGLAVAVLAVMYVGLAYVATQHVTQRWARPRVAVAVVLLGATPALARPTTVRPAAGVVFVLCYAAAAVLLCAAAVGLLHMALRDSESTLSALSDRVVEVETRNRADRERLHEVSAAIAGIVTASELIHHGLRIPDDRRAQLERLVESEIARLGNLVAPHESAICEVDLDEALEPVVVAQQILGRDIDWEPSGHVVLGRAQDIAEVFTTLLENAAQHAAGSRVRITARATGDSVELRVSDGGPGIPHEVSTRLFEWGERGPASQGQGIGLHVARRLVDGLGGSLRALSSPGSGATFALSLPQVTTSRESTHAGA